MRVLLQNHKDNTKTMKLRAVLMALLAAVLYGISSPFSKLLLTKIPPTLLAALLYLGAGSGMLMIDCLTRLNHRKPIDNQMTIKELPYITGMIILDIAAPNLLMYGLTLTSSENAALLNNFEIVATSLIALFIFKEVIGKRMWIAILLITLSSIILTVQDFEGFSFNVGSVFVLVACVCWGFENNCTRMLSYSNPIQIVVIKGFGSGMGALLIAIAGKQFCNNIRLILLSLLLGFVAYGLSIFFYIYAQRELGAARTSAFYAAAPFIGVVISWLIFREIISVSFLAALFIMITGSYLAVSDLKHSR